MFERIQRLVRAFGVSGGEREIANLIEEEIRLYVDSVHRDALGNLIAVKRIGTSESPQKIMLAAHMDTVGILVTHVEDAGYIRFSNLGGLRPHTLIGQTVAFENGLKGVIYHEASVKELKDVKMGSLFIDAGLGEAAKKKITPGMYGRFVFSTYQQEDSIISGYLDDRAGCAALLETARILQEETLPEEFSEGKEIYYVFTAQEELGLRGAGPAAFSVDPDLAITVDVTHAEDLPGAKDGTIKVGSGPVIQIKDTKTIYHPFLRAQLKLVAEENKIPVQYGISNAGGTDAGVIHMSQGGIVTGGISIPVRYMHSPAELCSLQDLKDTVTLLTGMLKISS